jgi:hypothetical protein
MYLEARRDRAVYECDCCKARYEGPLFSLKDIARKDYCPRCQAAWFRFCQTLRFYLA